MSKPRSHEPTCVSQPHLATGLRHWMEAVAQEEYRLAHGTLPPLNRVADGEIILEEFVTTQT